MVEKINLDMKGLKFIVIAQIISLVYGVAVGGLSVIRGIIVGASVNNEAHGFAPNAIMMFINFLNIGAGVAIIVLMIMGLSRLTQYSESFKKSRLFYIINLVSSLIFVFVVIVFCGIFLVRGVSAGNDYGDISSFKPIFITVMVLLGLYLVAAAVLSIMYVRMLCLGCTELALATGNNVLENKFTKIEKAYRICMIIYTVGVVIATSIIFSAVVKLFANLNPYFMTPNSDMITGVISMMILAAIIILALSIMIVVIEIIITINLWNAWKAFEGREVYISKGSNGTVLIPAQELEMNSDSQGI